MNFSVIIATHNRAPFISRAVDSALLQCKGAAEVIVVDDGSTDDTYARLKEKILNNKIIYLYQDNKGVSAARNSGATLATGDYLVFLDSDDYFTANRCLSHLKYINNEDYAPDVVYSPWITINQAGKILRIPGNEIPPNLLYPKLLVRGLAALSACTFRKPAFIKSGGFNNELKGCEDWEIIQKMVIANSRFLYCPVPSTVYVKHETNCSKNTMVMLQSALKVVEIGFSSPAITKNTKDMYFRDGQVIQYLETCRRLILAGNLNLTDKILSSLVEQYEPSKFWSAESISDESRCEKFDKNRLIGNYRLILQLRSTLEENIMKDFKF